MNRQGAKEAKTDAKTDGLELVVDHAVRWEAGGLTVAQSRQSWRRSWRSWRLGPSAVVAALDRLAPSILLLGMLAFTMVFTSMALARLAVYRQGFDLVSYVQPIWNTAQGRPFEQSVYAGAPTILGIDLFLVEGWLALPYALAPGYGTLFGLLTAITALGGLAVYLVAREALGGRTAALLSAGLYLGSLTIQSVAPYEFRPRLIAATALLFAFWCQRRGWTPAFWLALLMAITVRLDVALVVAMLGLHGLVERRPWTLGLAPLIGGLAYWLLGLLVVVPALRQGEPFLFLFYFAWLGETPGEIARTVLTRPDYVLAGVLTPPKLLYLLQLLWPVAGLALLRPIVLLPALPILAINLLGSERTQHSIIYDYSVLIVPWVVLAAVLASADLVQGRGWAGQRLARWWPTRPPPPGLATAVVGLLLLATLSQQVALGSPLLQYARGYRPAERAAAAQRVLAALPPEAPAAVSSELAPHVPLRRHLYYFPGNRAYSPALVERAAWVVGDRRRSEAERAAIEGLERSGRYRLALEADDYVLLERLPPPPGPRP